MSQVCEWIARMGPISFVPSAVLTHDLTSSEWAESSDANPDPTAASTPKPRRSRARARKAVQATETVTDSVSVVWIQTGPGKFVRVEGGVRAARSAEIESVFTRAYPATDLPAEAIQAVPTQV